ncbi:MAG: zinc ABC transporter substrate-binding protein [Pseudomonadota bacterium]|nr:zinc ABC transporter substrate-binding protein [Pseudomonadota bacterium]
MKRCYSVVMGFLLLLSSPSLLFAEPLTVYTVNYPLQYFTRRIAGDHARVVFPAPPDVDPAFWMPDRKTIGDYQQADLIVLNGAAYAGWISKASLPRLHQIDTSKAFKNGLIMVKDTVTHSHGPAGAHSHAGTAFTTWLDFYQAVQQAEAITEALSRRQPEYKADFEKNFVALRKDLMALDLALQQVVAVNPRQRLFASHPIYHYLVLRYELHIEDMVWEPDDMPNDQQWQQLRLVHESFPADWMLWEKQPLPEIAQQLDSMGIGIAVFDPCANRPASGDFLSVMQKNIANLRQAYTD